LAQDVSVPAERVTGSLLLVSFDGETSVSEADSRRAWNRSACAAFHRLTRLGGQPAPSSGETGGLDRGREPVLSTTVRPTYRARRFRRAAHRLVATGDT
jgi:hypothetical protein